MLTSIDARYARVRREATELLGPAKVFALERAIREDLADKLVELHVEHYLAGGVYVRELHIPAGTVLTGHIHLKEHIAMVTQGDISVYCGDTAPVRLVAPCTFVSQPGIKRAGFAHKDTLFVTVHRLEDPEERDLDKIEAECVVKTPQEYEAKQGETPNGGKRVGLLETPGGKERAATALKAPMSPKRLAGENP